MEQFLQAVKEQAKKFKTFKDKPIKLVAHLDADGLSSAAIMIRALRREDAVFSLSTVRQLDNSVFEWLRRENYPVIFFLDLGSGSLSKIESVLYDREIFVLDHHGIENYGIKKINLLNPMLYGIDGNKEISGAGVCYLFAKALNSDNMDLAYIGLLGAIGDIQENNGFYSDLNNFILDDAINTNKVEVKIGLRMFGMQTRSLNKMLEYTTDLFIPGVTGNDEGARRFIDELGIDAKIDGKYKKLVQLKIEDLRRLVTGIVLRRIGSEERPEDVLGKIYLLKDENDESPMRDAREFSTLLNACGRMDKPALGIGCCLGDSSLKKGAINLLYDYKREIIKSLNWFNDNKEKMINGNGYVIINAGFNVKDTMIGTLASIVARSNMYEFGTIILSMAYTLDGQIKISIRNVANEDLDLRDVITRIVNKVDGICGGHRLAAGALITQEKEDEFIRFASEVLNQVVVLK